MDAVWYPFGGPEVMPDGADFVHLLVATALTYALGFERDLRGASAGDRVFGLIGVAAGVVGVLAVHGAPTALQGALTGVGFIGAGLVFRQESGKLQMVRGLTTAAAIFAAVAIGAAAGEGRLLLATVATALALLALEARYLRVLTLLDGRRWANRFRHDESARGADGAAADEPRREQDGHLPRRCVADVLTNRSKACRPGPPHSSCSVPASAGSSQAGFNVRGVLAPPGGRLLALLRPADQPLGARAPSTGGSNRGAANP